MTVPKRAPNIDTTCPPEGLRLLLGTTAAALKVTVSDMATATGVSRTAIANLLTNTWPVKTEAAELRSKLHQLFADRGATDKQLQELFYAHNHRSGQDKANQMRVEANLPPQARRGHLPDDTKTQPVRAPRAAQAKSPQEDETMLLPKQTLSRAACKAFGVFSNPFDGEVTTEEQMFTSPEIAYVRETCLQAAVGQRFVAIVAESGAGKSTILADLEARLQRDNKQVIVIKPWVLGMEDTDSRGKTLKATDILASIITTLDTLATVPQTLQARSNKARDLLTRSVEAGYSHVLLIEEAHSMPDATLKHLKRLHEMRVGRKALLGILLLGQTELAQKLDPRRASLREVTQRCEVVQLMPLDADLSAYLAHRAGLAGKKLDHFITADGVEEIRARLTVTRPAPGGQQRATSLLYPLAVNNMVTAALNQAAELGVPIVNRDVVRAF